MECLILLLLFALAGFLGEEAKKNAEESAPYIVLGGCIALLTFALAIAGCYAWTFFTYSA